MVPSYEPVAWDHRPERPYSERLQNKKLTDDSKWNRTDGTMVPSYEPVAWDHRPERPSSGRLQNKNRTDEPIDRTGLSLRSRFAELLAIG
jgi:hypothetical protein